MKRLKVYVDDTTSEVGSASCSLQIGSVLVGVLSPDNVDDIIKALIPHAAGGWYLAHPPAKAGAR